MNEPAPGSRQFFRSIWRQRPALYRAVVGTRANDTMFANWCVPPVRARIYTLAEDGYGHAVEIAIDEAWPMAKYLAKQHEKFTLVLNGIEASSLEACLIRDRFRIGRSWRYDDIVATWSPAGCGIGYHAGHEDGFIVQLSGKRRWKIWGSSETPDEHRIALVTPGRQPDALPKTEAEPLIDEVLNPGDAIYVPPFAPHSGITGNGPPSIGLSIGWRGVTSRVLLNYLGVDPRAQTPTLDELLPDHDPAAPETVELLTRQLLPALGEPGSSRHIEKAMMRSVRALLRPAK